MKFLSFRTFLFVVAVATMTFTIALAQPAQENVVVVNNAELSLSGERSISPFDSLAVDYVKECRVITSMLLVKNSKVLVS
ncbi:MAG: hypothetical protein ACHQLA_06510 [Ignavibacteriales bacterium]